MNLLWIWLGRLSKLIRQQIVLCDSWKVGRAILEVGWKIEGYLFLIIQLTQQVLLIRANRWIGCCLKKIWSLCDLWRSLFRLTYTGEAHVSMASFIPEQTNVINGLSKSHAMTGWRLGFIFARLWWRLNSSESSYLVTCWTMNQYAIEALTAGRDDAEPMKKEYVKRQDYIIKKYVNAWVWDGFVDGAFYILLKSQLVLIKIPSLSCKILRVAVALFLIAAFGQYGEGYVRLSYAASMELSKLWNAWRIIWKNMLWSQWDRELSCIIGISWGWQASQNLHRSQEADVFVKHAGKSQLNPMLQPLVTADMLLKINDDRLSYIINFKICRFIRKINADLFALSYATYVLAACRCKYSRIIRWIRLFAFWKKTLSDGRGTGLWGFDQYFEISDLSRFGVILNLWILFLSSGWTLITLFGIVGFFVRIWSGWGRAHWHRKCSIYWIFKQYDSVS